MLFTYSVLYHGVSECKQKNNWHINQSYHFNNFVTLRNIQHISGNRPLGLDFVSLRSVQGTRGNL